MPKHLGLQAGVSTGAEGRGPRTSYSRMEAAYPDSDPDVAAKYWPPVSRIDNVAGDRNLVCSCPPVDAYTDAAE